MTTPTPPRVLLEEELNEALEAAKSHTTRDPTCTGAEVRGMAQAITDMRATIAALRTEVVRLTTIANARDIDCVHDGCQRDKLHKRADTAERALRWLVGEFKHAAFGHKGESVAIILDADWAAHNLDAWRT